jgi:hypothetical protein
MLNVVKARSAFGVALVLFACALVAPTGASASRASIRATLKKDLPTILKVEGHVLSAEGEYASSHNPAGVEAAIEKSVAALGALRHRVAAQSASKPKVRTARAKIVKGLAGIILGYGHLKTAFADKVSDPATAKSEAASALAAVKTGKRELSEGVKLLR